MFLTGSISRWLSTGGLCCLMVVGGLPRSWCLCPEEACRIACDSRANVLALAGARDDSSGCRCCDKPADSGPGTPQIAGTACACQVQVTQVVLVTAGRDAQVKAESPALWVATAEHSLLAGADRTVLASPVFGPPPDDPVSRAQILRL
jgi:hypothetical protein